MTDNEISIHNSYEEELVDPNGNKDNLTLRDQSASNQSSLKIVNEENGKDTKEEESQVVPTLHLHPPPHLHLRSEKYISEKELNEKILLNDPVHKNVKTVPHLEGTH